MDVLNRAELLGIGVHPSVLNKLAGAFAQAQHSSDLDCAASFQALLKWNRKHWPLLMAHSINVLVEDSAKCEKVSKISRGSLLKVVDSFALEERTYLAEFLALESDCTDRSEVFQRISDSKTPVAKLVQRLGKQKWKEFMASVGKTLLEDGKGWVQRLLGAAHDAEFSLTSALKIPSTNLEELVNSSGGWRLI